MLKTEKYKGRKWVKWGKGLRGCGMRDGSSYLNRLRGTRQHRGGIVRKGVVVFYLPLLTAKVRIW
ncbi:hypothetical protein CW713_11685 [Methanophagales archaeon]|nr:MAG: hypothetical protein CW713_11685 [Methanophagales archaeon]